MRQFLHRHEWRLCWPSYLAGKSIRAEVKRAALASAGSRTDVAYVTRRVAGWRFTRASVDGPMMPVSASSTLLSVCYLLCYLLLLLDMLLLHLLSF